MILAMVVSRNSLLTMGYEFFPEMVTPASQAENASSILVARSNPISLAGSGVRVNRLAVLFVTVRLSLPLFSSVRCRESVASRPSNRSHIL